MRKKYFFLSMKRTFRFYPIILFVTIITIMSVLLASGIILANKLSDKNNIKIRVGLVGNLDDTYLGASIYALKNIDSSKYSIDFIDMTETEAEKELEKRHISGYVLIPEGFVRSLVNGSNYPVTYVTMAHSASFTEALTEEITGAVSDIVIETQCGIYSMQDVAVKYKVKNIKKHKNEFNLKYIEYILGREAIYDIKNIGTADFISFGGYVICGIITALLLFWGISCSGFLTKKDYALSRSLSVRGLGGFAQIICESLSFFFVTFVTVILFSLIFGYITEITDFGIAELKTSGISSCIAFTFKIAPVILMFNAMQIMLYELAEGTVSSVMLQFITSVSLSYISGCFYPNDFFPDTVQKFSAFLPSGIGFSYLRKCMSFTLSVSDLCYVFMYIVIFIVLSSIVRKFRTEGNV